jgi:hypothetical protein
LLYLISYSIIIAYAFSVSTVMSRWLSRVAGGGDRPQAENKRPLRLMYFSRKYCYFYIKAPRELKSYLFGFILILIKREKQVKVKYWDWKFHERPTLIEILII